MTIVGPDTTGSYPEITKRVHGVFKGGGAKGLVYAGALHEVRARGIWFESVAGASAGAITATLVAAGYDPIEILRWAPEALQRVKVNRVRWVANVERSFFETDGLRHWVEERLRAMFTEPPPSAPITFQQLQSLGVGIELNVVAMDLARNEPILFNWRITPDFGVAEAVIASSAIPVAMPARRVLIQRQSQPSEVHRLVDGGTWANYPAFVYRDPSVRSFFGLPELAAPETLGFVIESREYADDLDWSPAPNPYERPAGWRWPATAPQVASGTGETIVATSSRRTRYDLGSARRMGMVGALLTWAGLRWLLLVLVSAGVYALIQHWGAGVIEGDPLDLPGPYPRAAAVLMFIAMVVVFSLSVGIVVLVIRFGSEAIDSGLPSLLAATSSSIGVARWVGHSASDRVIRLSAPLSISVVGFSAKPALQWLAAVVAAAQTADQLSRLYPTASRGTGVPALDELPTGLGDPELLYLHEYRRRQRGKDLKPASDSLFLVVFWAIVSITIVWLLPGVVSIVLALIIGVPFTAYGIWHLLKGRMYNQSMTSRQPTPPNAVWRFLPAVVLLAFGLVGLANPRSVDGGELLQLGGLFLGQVYEFAAGLSLLIGLGCLISGFSRLSARWAARRYRRETSG